MIDTTREAVERLIAEHFEVFCEHKLIEMLRALLAERDAALQERDRLREALEDAKQRLIDGDLWPCAICGHLLSDHGSQPHGFEYEWDEDDES